MNTHLVLVSDQVIPNFTPILDERFRPEKVVLLVSKSKQLQADNLAKIYKPRGIKVSFWPIDDAWDIEHVRSRIETLLITQTFNKITLNVTGGTKPMSIAAYEVFRENQLDIFYIHPYQDKLIWMHPKQAAVEIADRIKLTEFLQAHGADHVNRLHQYGVPKKLRDLTQTIIHQIKYYKAAISHLNFLASSADNRRLSCPFSTPSGSKSTPFLHLIELFEHAGLLTTQDHTLQFCDEQARFFANGGWLEQFIYACCLDLKSSCTLQDISQSLEVSRRQGKETIKNELDVALLKDNRLFIIECKTKRYSGNGQKHSEGADVLYKLDSIRDVLAGEKSKAMLVSIKPLNKYDLNRAKELDITVCCGEDIQNFKHLLHTWIMPTQ